MHADMFYFKTNRINIDDLDNRHKLDIFSDVGYKSHADIFSEQQDVVFDYLYYNIGLRHCVSKTLSTDDRQAHWTKTRFSVLFIGC